MTKKPPYGCELRVCAIPQVMWKLNSVIIETIQQMIGPWSHIVICATPACCVFLWNLNYVINKTTTNAPSYLVICATCCVGNWIKLSTIQENDDPARGPLAPSITLGLTERVFKWREGGGCIERRHRGTWGVVAYDGGSDPLPALESASGSYPSSPPSSPESSSRRSLQAMQRCQRTNIGNRFVLRIVYFVNSSPSSHCVVDVHSVCDMESNVFVHLLQQH